MKLNYIEAAREYDISERTLYRWLEIIRAENPEVIITESNGKRNFITEEGYALLGQVSEEVKIGLRNIEDEEDVVAIATTTHPYLESQQSQPNFSTAKKSLSDILETLALRSEQLGYELGYQATYTGLGNGITRGQEAAIKKIGDDAQL